MFKINFDNILFHSLLCNNGPADILFKALTFRDATILLAAYLSITTRRGGKKCLREDGI